VKGKSERGKINREGWVMSETRKREKSERETEAERGVKNYISQKWRAKFLRIVMYFCFVTKMSHSLTKKYKKVFFLMIKLSYQFSLFIRTC